MPAGCSAAHGHEWLLEEWAIRFSAGFEAMAGAALARKASPPPAGGRHSLAWRQSFDVADGATVDVVIPEAGWLLVGQRILRAAGIEEASDEDCRPTCLEVLQQSLAGLASALSSLLGREVARAKGGPLAAGAGDGSLGMTFEIDRESFAIGFAASPALLEALRPQPAAEIPVPEAPPQASGALEILYDVELPVSISFGRAHMPVKEVLKLTSGSIVELNRGISEPVEIIVNNCVIARGEVVVVDGNYGVRILEIVSRSERLRTLH